MALEITGTIELSSGLSLSSVYGRTNYRVSDSSDSVSIFVEYWVDEDAYTNEKSGIKTNLNVDGRYAYDRTTDGSDVLLFTQNKIKEELENLGFSVVITEL